MAELPPEIKRLIVKEKRQRERWDVILKQINNISRLPYCDGPNVVLLPMNKWDTAKPGILVRSFVLRTINSFESPFFSCCYGWFSNRNGTWQWSE
jgi:hypothetical protein